MKDVKRVGGWRRRVGVLDVEEGVLDVDKDEERDRQITQNSLCLHCLGMQK